jgi:hypothetical protein
MRWPQPARGQRYVVAVAQSAILPLLPPEE